MSREAENIFDKVSRELFGKPWADLAETPEREQVRVRINEILRLRSVN